LLLCLLLKRNLPLRVLLVGIALFLLAQSALTFSRGGLYDAAGTLGIALFLFARDGKRRLRLIVLTAILLFAAIFVLLPRLDDFTGGALSSRFESVDLTGRDRIAWEELAYWAQNPIFGIGAGRTHEMVHAAPHTEFARLVAEHGIFGIGAMVILLILGLQNFKRAPERESRAVVASLIAWSCLFMLNAGMRLVAPSFMFGLSFVTVLAGAPTFYIRRLRAGAMKPVMLGKASAPRPSPRLA